MRSTCHTIGSSAVTMPGGAGRTCLAALNIHEMLSWDGWGIDFADDPTPKQIALLEEVAAAGTFAERMRLFVRADLRVPAEVMSFTPGEIGSPIQVSVRTTALVVSG